MAKVRVTPAADAVRSLAGKSFDVADEDGLRTATADDFRANEARYDVAVQLAVDPERTPIEAPAVERPEDVTSYRPAGQLVFPPARCV